MKKSQIIDLEQVMEVVAESLDAAERMAGIEVHSCWLSVSGAHIHSQNSKGVVAVAAPDQEISPLDVERVIEAARAVSLPSDKEIIHVIPNTFKVDSQEGIKDPVGMAGVRLEAEAHIITAMSVSLKNLLRILDNLGLASNGFVFSGLASADVVVSDTEKELGVCVVDIGAGTTSLCCYVDGSLAYSGSVPIGARHITQDIALGCRVSLDVAEQIKIKLSSEHSSSNKPTPGESKSEFQARRKKEDELRLSEVTNGESQEVLSRKVILDGIIVPRITELCSVIMDKLKTERLETSIPAGLVLTGGGAETIGIVQVAKQHTKLPARVGMPIELDGLTLDIHKPAFATSIGLLHYGKTHGADGESGSFSLGTLSTFGKGGKLIQRATQWIKSLLP
jgi:cell division protein FtsA